MSQSTRDVIRDFIRTQIMRKPTYRLGDDDPIITGGLIDSFALVEVQMFIQEKYGFMPDDIDMTVATMNTVAMIADYVDAHTKK
ncbi:MAG: hypothetical protein OHK0023_23420 [Anaerolineae bacterium]